MLNKDQVRKLTLEQQEALGGVEAQRVRVRQKLVEDARRYRGVHVVGIFLMCVAIGLAIFYSAQLGPLSYGIIAVACLAQFHALGLNRRIDALMKLLDSDLN